MRMIKTTLLLRKDVHQRLVAEFGKRNLSEGVNEVLFRELIKTGQKSMFGADKGLRLKPFEREHHDRF